jgi:hypothetical protein
MQGSGYPLVQWYDINEHQTGKYIGGDCSLILGNTLECLEGLWKNTKIFVNIFNPWGMV